MSPIIQIFLHNSCKTMTSTALINPDEKRHNVT
jgi:hypothetical protein